jgi:hypothetical protein
MPDTDEHRCPNCDSPDLASIQLAAINHELAGVRQLPAVVPGEVWAGWSREAGSGLEPKLQSRASRVFHHVSANTTGSIRVVLNKKKESVSTRTASLVRSMILFRKSET